MKPRIALLALVLLAAPCAVRAFPPVSSQGNAELRKVVLRTWPPGARVALRGSVDQLLGRSGEPIYVNLTHLHQFTTFELQFDLPGYEPRLERLPGHALDAGLYPAEGDPPLHLTAKYPLVVDAWYACALHPAGAAAIAACLLGAVAVLVPRARRRRRAEQATVQRARRIEQLTASADRTDPLMGAVLGGYRIVDRLGEGGMATVYLAVPDDTLDEAQAVALKVIARDLGGDPEFVRRFNHEVRAGNALKHPSIVQLYAAGEQDGIYFLAMERVRGTTLRARIRPGGIPLDEAVRILQPIFDAVAFAHRQGIVHRDLKPDNVMITPDNVVKVMDFGLARSHNFSAITMTGTAIGTPAYMSPEQIRSQGVDGRADQYALGIMAYELLCGRKPFEEEQSMALVFKHLTEEPPPVSQLRAGLPAGLDAVLLRMVAKDANDRFRRVEDSAQALEEAGLPRRTRTDIRPSRA